MDQFINEIREFSEKMNLLPVELANFLERYYGVEVGTQKNLEILRHFLEQFVDQTAAALELLNEEQHLIAVRCLSTLLKYYREALADVNKKLRTGDYMQGN